jgi:hypothetical protein
MASEYRSRRRGVIFGLRMRFPQIPAFFALLGAELLVSGLSRTAEAQPKRVLLDYQRLEGGAACPDASALQVGVAARLGYDPFSDKAAERLKVTIRPSTNGLEARIELQDRDGKLKAERRMVSRQRDCKELASSVELAISIAIDPSAYGTHVALPADPDPPALASPIPPPAAPPPVEAKPSRPLHGELTAMLVGGLRSAPSTSLGFSLGAALGGEILSVGIEARADVPSSKSLQAGSVASSLYTFSLVPCLRATYLGFCALAAVGVQHASGQDLVNSKTVDFLYLAVGARVALAYPLGPRWSLGLFGDALSPLTENSLAVDDNRNIVWRTPALAFAVSLGVAAKIP